MANDEGLNELTFAAEKEIASAASREDIEKLRVSLLGRKSPLTERIRSIGALDRRSERARGRS